MEILPNDINVTIVNIIKSTFYCHFLPSPDNLCTARRMALDRGLQLWRLWSEISHQFFNHCLESIVLKSLINATRLEAVEELWSLIVGYERHDHLLVSSFVIIVSSLCHHCIIIVSSLCNRCVIVVASLCHHCSIILSSLCHHSVTFLSSFCHHSVIILSLCVIVSGSWGTSFLRNCTGGHSRPLCGRPGC